MPPESPARRCRCGHPREAHSHHRTGGECAAPCECARWDRRFLALRACWAILRGRSVAWKLGLAPDVSLRALGDGLFTADCLVDGKPGQE